MSKIDKKLQAEARAWLEGKRQGPLGKDHFIVFPDGTGWTLLIKPVTGADTIATGLTFGEANRLRLELSDAGYVGKILG